MVPSPNPEYKVRVETSSEAREMRINSTDAPIQIRDQKSAPPLAADAQFDLT